MNKNNAVLSFALVNKSCVQWGIPPTEQQQTIEMMQHNLTVHDVNLTNAIDLNTSSVN